MKALIQPQAVELEEIILAAILLEADAFDKISEIITENTFYKENHRHIYDACKKLKIQNSSIDLLSVVEQLKKDGNLEIVGGPYTIAQLTSKISSSANIEQHARIIKEKELRREIISIAHESIKNAYDDTFDTFENIVNASLHTTNLLEAGSNTKLDKLNDVIIQNHKDRLLPKEGQRSKFDGLPDYKKGKVYILAARPGMGKTTFAINEGYKFSKNGVVLMASLEMPSTEIVTKIESLESRIPSWRIEKNKIFREEQQKYDKLRLVDTNFYIDDTPAITLMHLKTKASKLKKEKGLSMIIVDYLQLMRGDTNGNREQEIGSLSRGLKELAKLLEVPIIVLSQLSRAVETRANKKPMLSDLRESGSIEQDADVVMFLFRPMYYALASGDQSLIDATDKNLVEVIVAKNRGGKVGIFEVSCDLEISEFRNKDQFCEDLEIDENPPF